MSTDELLSAHWMLHSANLHWSGSKENMAIYIDNYSSLFSQTTKTIPYGFKLTSQTVQNAQWMRPSIYMNEREGKEVFNGEIK